MRADLQALASELGISATTIAARGLTECVEATELERVEVGEEGQEYFLVPAAAQAWRSMQAAALADNVQLFIVSAFRSIERQTEIVRRKLATGQSIDEILAVCAPPGFSEHHTGCAVDISTPGAPVLETAFDQTAAFAWLTRHGADFGFYLSFPAGNACGFIYEPWHWCYRHSPPGQTANRQSQRKGQ